MEDCSYTIIGCVYDVYNKLGPGLLESVYEKALMISLAEKGLHPQSQVPIDVEYDGKPLGLGFRIDILVNDSIVIELKSVETIMPIHKKQLLTYLKLADKRLGLLINFNEYDIKRGITRIVNNF